MLFYYAPRLPHFYLAKHFDGLADLSAKLRVDGVVTTTRAGAGAYGLDQCELHVPPVNRAGKLDE